MHCCRCSRYTRDTSRGGSEAEVKTLSVLGSTGSIGESTLDLVTRFPERFRVAALAAAGTNPSRLAEQVRQTIGRFKVTQN